MVNLGGRQMLVNAFLDGGSDASYIREDVARALGATCHQENLQIATLGGAVINQPTSEIVIDVGGANEPKFIANIQAWTLPVICEDLDLINWEADKQRWSQLMEIDFKKPADPGVVDLLIGSDYPELHEVWERRSGPPQTLVAERTPLGWVCVGPVGAAASPPPTRRPRVGVPASATVSGQQALKRVCEEGELATKKPKSDSEKEKHEKERQAPDLHQLGQQEPQPFGAVSPLRGPTGRSARAAATRRRGQVPQAPLAARSEECVCEPNLASVPTRDAAQSDPSLQVDRCPAGHHRRQHRSGGGSCHTARPFSPIEHGARTPGPRRICARGGQPSWISQVYPAGHAPLPSGGSDRGLKPPD